MDELKLLRTFESEVPPLTQTARGQARHRLLRTIAADNNRVRPRRPSMRISRVRLVTAGAVAVAVAAGAVASQVVGEDTATQPPMRPASAAYVLERAAVTAAARPWQSAPRPTQWLYEKTVPPKINLEQGEWIRYDGRRYAWWERGKLIGERGKMRVGPNELHVGPRPVIELIVGPRRKVPDDVRQILSQGEAVWVTVGSSGGQPRIGVSKLLAAATDFKASPRQWRHYLESLPTDPERLLERIYRDVQPGRPDPLRRYAPDKYELAFGAISKLLTCGALIPPDINAALYRAAAKIPGVRAETGITDAAGRTGIAVSRHFRDGSGALPPFRQQIIFNPDTYAYWGYRYVTDRSATLTMPRPKSGSRQVYVRAGHFLGGAAIITSALVDRPGQFPK